ncbi:unnamed protein product, partial [Iphiclides podalirius]
MSANATVIFLFVIILISAEDIYEMFENEDKQSMTETEQNHDPQIKRKSSELWNVTSKHFDKWLQMHNGTCDSLQYKMPDFRGDARRISEVKCLEYVWQIRYEVEKYKRDFMCNKQDQENIVVGGDDAQAGEFPHMCAIGWQAAASSKWLFKCGGVLISNKYVLTAAHCSRVSRTDISVSEQSPKIVRFGALNELERIRYGIPSKDVKISKVIVHEKYNSPKTYYDIALIELDDEATLAGWGVVDPATGETSDILQVAALDMLPSQQCNDTLKTRRNRNWKNGLASHQICAGHLLGGIDACQGDSGGPLQIKIDTPLDARLNWRIYYIVGITSFGHGCAHPNTPSVFSRVSHFTEWIENIVWSTT